MEGKSGEYSVLPLDAIDWGIGMVHQHFNLVDNHTVLENIVIGDSRAAAGTAWSTMMVPVPGFWL